MNTHQLKSADHHTMDALIQPILHMPMIGSLLVVLLCAALSSWGLVPRGTTALRSLAERSAAMFDSILPEITFRDGKPSIREEQPYFSYPFGKNTALVIDTREAGLNALLSDIRGASTAVLLARETIMVKFGSQVRILPLPEIPDTVVNPTMLHRLIQERFPRITGPLATVIIICCLLAKFVQVMLFGLATCSASRICASPWTYTEAIKLACAAMIFPELLAALICAKGLPFAVGLIVYFALYGALLALCLSHSVRASLSGRYDVPS